MQMGRLRTESVRALLQELSMYPGQPAYGRRGGGLNP